MLQLIVFFLYPALEIYALIALGRHTGGLFLVFWTFASAGLGVWVIKKQGRYCMNEIARDLEKGLLPQNVMVDSILVFFAGILLILPGVISDAVGLLLLIPFARGLGLGLAANTITRQYTASRQGGGAFKVFTFNSGNFSETPYFGDATRQPGQPRPADSDGEIIDADFTESSEHTPIEASGTKNATEGPESDPAHNGK